MDVVIRDSIATTRESVLWAAIVENIDRQDFDVLEEAHAVEFSSPNPAAPRKPANALSVAPGGSLDAAPCSNSPPNCSKPSATVSLP